MSNTIPHNANLKYINRQLDLHQTQASKRMEQIASGQRLNRVGDDPTSLDTANHLSAEFRAVAQGNRNAQQGVHLLQLADGALAQISTIVQRMRSMAVSGASGLLPKEGQQTLATEFATLKNEGDRIARFTTFNQTPLLDRDQTLTIQLGPNGADATAVSLRDARPSGDYLNLAGLSLATPQDAVDALNILEAAEDRLNNLRGTIGALQNRVSRYAETSATAMGHLLDTQSQIADVDLAQSVTQMTSAQILSQASGSIFVGAQGDVDSIIALLNN